MNSSLDPVQSSGHFSQALAALAQAVSRSTEWRGNWLRVEIPWAGSPFAAVRAFQDAPSIYWRQRDGSWEVGGLGAARSFTGGERFELVRRVEDALTNAPDGLRAFGGCAFFAGGADAPEWAAFGEGRFVVPRVEFLRDERGTRLVCNLHAAEPRLRGHAVSECLAALAGMRFGVKNVEKPLVLNRSDAPELGEWCAALARALDAFDAGLLQKVVLARRTSVATAEVADVVTVAECVFAEAVSSFNFLFRFSAHGAFAGASPERLFARSGARLVSEALAGTVSASESAGTALDADKLSREHGLVEKRVEALFRQLCDPASLTGETGVVALARMRHRVRRFSGRLVRPSVGLDDLLRSFHPTPAVGGTPVDEALAFLREHEPFERGWYAAPVGWVAAGGAEFAVAIRSALQQGCTWHLFAGAGIVPGSDPRAEWDEVELKASAFLDALGAWRKGSA